MGRDTVGNGQTIARTTCEVTLPVQTTIIPSPRFDTVVP